MKVWFYGETRKLFLSANTEGAVPMLGNFDVKEILVNEKWQNATEASVSFVASEEWMQNCLFPGRNPSIASVPYRRARYFSFTKEDKTVLTLVLEDFDAVPLGDGNVEITVYGRDPRVFSETMSSSNASIGENWVTDRLTIAAWLSQRLSNSLAAGMEDWQKLPITQLNPSYTPTTAEAAIGLKKADDVTPAGNIEIGSPDPLPVYEAIQDLFANWLNAELYPINKFGADGTESPWWQWGIRTRMFSTATFSESNGTMKLNKYNGTWKNTETLAYSSNDQTKFAYTNGKTISRSRLSGPWAGIRTESVSIPEKANVDQFLRSKAKTGTMNNSRLTVDCEIDFTKNNVVPVCGMTVFVRIGSKIYNAEVNEVASHFSYETGWRSTSPVFVNMDSVDQVDPIDEQKDIQFVVSGSTFVIPTNCSAQEYYSWRVYVDGRSYGVFQGTSSATSGGIPLEIGENTEHTIILQPSDGRYYYGWGRAFGFNQTNSSIPSLTTTNKNKVRRVLNDPDYAHLTSETYTGSYYRAYQWHGCTNLTQIVAEEMPNTVVVIGNYAFMAQYYDCRSLTYAATEYISPNITEIDHEFRRQQYYQCNLLATPSVEHMPDSVISVGDHFRSEMYSSNLAAYKPNITTAPSEKHSANLETIGHYFRYRQYYRCNLLTVAATEAPINVIEIPNYFRSQQYYDCTKLVNISDEAPTTAQVVGFAFRNQQYYGCIDLQTAATEQSTGATIIGDNFRGAQYVGCTSLVNIFDEVAENPNTIGGAYRSGQYQNCTSLTYAAQEYASNITTAIGSAFRQSQYKGCTKLTTCFDEKISDNILEIPPRFRESQYSGCKLLTSIGKEAFPVNAEKISFNYFRYAQFSNIGQAIPPEEAPMPSLTGQINPPGQNNYPGYRERQYYNSEILEIAKEADFPATYIGRTETNFRAQQYEGCPNIKNDRLLTEGSIASFYTIMRNYRNRQFYNSGIVHPLKENDPYELTTGGSAYTNFSYRESMYENCYYLQEVAVEQDHPEWRPSIYSNLSFRVRQYANCVQIDPRGQNVILKDALVPNARGANYRREQFANTVAKDTPADRINYLDGTPVIEGQDSIPTNFYTD